MLKKSRWAGEKSRRGSEGRRSVEAEGRKPGEAGRAGRNQKRL